MNVPKKWWWVVAIAVPVLVAVIGIGPDLLGLKGGGNPNLVYNRVDGSQFQGDVVFNPITYIQNEARAADGEALPHDVVALLEDAMRAIEDGAASKAVPLFQAAAEAAPTPAVLNNLGAAYLAAGEAERARETLLEAKAAETKPPEAAAALEHNLRQIAEATPAGPGKGPVEPTEWPGVSAQITRFDDAGGLVTLEVVYTNTGGETADVCIWPDYDYLVDEATGQRWDDQHNGGSLCSPGLLEPGVHRVAWSKFLIEEPRPDHFSAVVSGVVRPFEGLALGTE